MRHPKPLESLVNVQLETIAEYIPKFRLREFTSCLCSTAASALSFEGCVAGLDATETGNELSQPTLELISLMMCVA